MQVDAAAGQPRHGIDGRAVEADLEVQMDAGAVAGGPLKTEQRPGADALAGGNGVGRQVRVAGGHAAADGTVVTAACTSAYCDRDGSLSLAGYGNLVELDHGGGVTTRYAHLSAYTVTAGQGVSAGALIGFQGSTGNSTGVHLHFEVRLDGASVDPVPWLADRGVDLHAATVAG